MATKVVEIKTLKQGKYLVLDGEASKIISISTSSPVNMELQKHVLKL